MSEDLKELLKKLKLDPSSTRARILTKLWDGDWVPIPELIDANSYQSDTPRRIRELRSEFGFEISQKGIGKNSSYRLESQECYGVKRREYLTSDQKRQLANRDGIRCNICGVSYPVIKGNLQADHRIPFKERGGPTTVENAQFLCVRCNVMKKRMCEFCNLEKCSDCAYAYPEKFGNLLLLKLPRDTIDQLMAGAIKENIEIEDLIKKSIEIYYSE